MIAENRMTVARRLKEVLARVDCRPWRIMFDHCEALSAVQVYAYNRQSYGAGPGKCLRSLRTADILSAAFGAIVAAEEERVRLRFTYRGRDIRNNLDLVDFHYPDENRAEWEEYLVARRVEQIDLEAEITAPRPAPLPYAEFVDPFTPEGEAIRL